MGAERIVHWAGEGNILGGSTHRGMSHETMQAPYTGSSLHSTRWRRTSNSCSDDQMKTLTASSIVWMVCPRGRSMSSSSGSSTMSGSCCAHWETCFHRGIGCAPGAMGLFPRSAGGRLHEEESRNCHRSQIASSGWYWKHFGSWGTRRRRLPPSGPHPPHIPADTGSAYCPWPSSM